MRLSEILETDIGLTLGLLNEKYNQYLDSNKEEEVIQGNADMLKKM